MVHDRGDASDHLRAASRQEVLHLGVPMKGMFPWIEQFFEIEKEWRNPDWIPLINTPGEFEEVLEVATSADGGDEYIKQHASDPMAAQPT